MLELQRNRQHSPRMPCSPKTVFETREKFVHQRVHAFTLDDPLEVRDRFFSVHLSALILVGTIRTANAVRSIWLVCLCTDIKPDTPAVLGECPLQFTGID